MSHITLWEKGLEANFFSTFTAILSALVGLSNTCLYICFPAVVRSGDYYLFETDSEEEEDEEKKDEEEKTEKALPEKSAFQVWTCQLRQNAEGVKESSAGPSLEYRRQPEGIQLLLFIVD